MKQKIDNPLARKDDLVVREMPDEVLVYDLKQHKAHCLNKTAAFIWSQCDGETSAAEIAVRVEEEWNKPVGEDVVWLALKQLDSASLLQESLVRPDSGMRVSRRAVMRKLGLATAATLPLILSVVVPTAAHGSHLPRW